jgi:hypothetical protein
MSRTPVPAPPDKPKIPEHLLEWIEKQNFSPLGTMNKEETRAWLNGDHKVPVTPNAVNMAIASGELPSTYISGRTLVSERDAILWALSRRREHGPRYSNIRAAGGPGRKPQSAKKASA